MGCLGLGGGVQRRKKVSPKRKIKLGYFVKPDSMPENLLFHCFLKCGSQGSEWPSSKNLQTVNAGDGMEKREPSGQIGSLRMQIVRATVVHSMESPLKN